LEGKIQKKIGQKKETGVPVARRIEELDSDKEDSTEEIVEVPLLVGINEID